MISSFGGKQEYRIAVRLPEGAHCVKRRFGEREIAVLGAFATMDMDHHPLAIDIAELQVHRFADPQAERVGNPNEALHAKSTTGIDHVEDLLLSDHLGQCGDMLDLGLFEYFPFSDASVSVEKLDPREEYTLGSGSDFEIDDLMEQEVANIRLGELFGRRLMEVGQFSDRPHIPIDGAFGLSSEAQVLHQLFVPFSIEVRGRFW